MKRAKGLFAILVALVLLLAIAVPAFAEGENQEVTDAKNGVVQIQMWFSDPEAAIETGTFTGSGFLINENTVITCQHVVSDFEKGFFVNWARFISQEYDVKRTAEQVKKLSEIRVSIYRDVYIKATIQKVSEEMDYAILKLDDPIQGRTPLSIRDSSTVKQTEDVFALGFPGDIQQLKDQNYYDTNDVTVTSGKVDKVDRMNFIAYGLIINDNFEYDYTEKVYKNVDCVASSAYIAEGNSGGPLVDSSGNVIGINAAGNGSRNIAISSNQLITVLKALGISYTDSSSSTTTTTAAQTTTSAVAKNPEPQPKKSGLSTGVIIGIAVAAVVVIALVVVIIIVASKKKKAAPEEAKETSVPGGFTPPATSTQTKPPVPAEGSEGTTVLSSNMGDPNATTVLSGTTTAYLLRTSNNEKINITKPYFKIGKDASRVDYCIKGNPVVSRFHASIVSKNGQYFIVDNGTTNHTYVNDSMIPANVETQISNGAKIKLADETFEFKI